MSAAAATVSVSDGALLFVAGDGEQNEMTMTQTDAGIEVVDDGAPLLVSDGCQVVDSVHAFCAAPIEAISVSLGDGDDDANLRDALAPVDLSGGPGDDLVQGGVVANGLQGGEGLDTLLGQSAGDTMAGGAGDDLLQAFDGDDIATGEDGIDVMTGGAGLDYLSGGLDEDLVYGGGGEDRLEGNGGADALIGGPGADGINGGPGADQAFAAEGGADVIDCGIGDDAVKVDATDRSSGCQGGDPLTERPRYWPIEARPSRTLQPLADPRITVKPRRRGAATWVRVQILDAYSYKAEVRINLTNRKRTRQWSRCVEVWSKHKVPVSTPRPPRWAYRGTGRFCR